MRTLFVLLLLCATVASAQTPDFALYGYAAMEGGTTGGEGGQVVCPTTFAELQQYASATEPYIICINREFKGPGVLRMGSNKTLIGLEDKAFINQIGVSIQCQSNIIIRNIRFTMTDVPITNDGENKIEGTRFDPDCIAIQADDEDLPEAQRKSYHIWIDHCEFYNEDPSVMTNYDRYDGLVDVKNDCQYITISWCYFHDHHKACLNGKGNSDDFDRKLTYHHNRFANIKSRMPLVRFGKSHIFNNYFDNCPEGDGINARIQSDIYLEQNYFNNVKKPAFGKLSEGGKVHLVDNAFINCSRLPAEYIDPAYKSTALSSSETFEDSEYVPPYLYSAVLTPVADVPAIVSEWAGINKIQTDYDTTAPDNTTTDNTTTDNTTTDNSTTDNTTTDNTTTDNTTTDNTTTDNTTTDNTTDNNTTSISEADTDVPFAYANGNTIYVSALVGVSVKVYNMSGQLAYCKVANQEQVNIDIAKTGIYIVQMGKRTTKVVIH